MQIHQIIKDTITNHKKKIELTQWAIISGISSLIYSEYISRIRQKQTPVKMILVPTIRSVQELLNPDSQFMKIISERLIDEMTENELFKKYANAPELVLFNEENIEIMKTIFDLYMIPNITRRIPETISKKFDLGNPKQQLIRESREIDLFDRQVISEAQFQFIVEECVLQLLLLIPTMKKNIELPESNAHIFMTKNEIITIGNANAICPIHLDDKIIQNKDVINLLNFVSSTKITKVDDGDCCAQKNDEIVRYLIETNIFNEVALISLQGIEFETAESTSEE